ncbi:MAG: glutathione S-transferase [Alphaproteobacteria bacterium]|nr:glutathione S-transferase [Alphaproteobacteria bacterium]
MRIVVHHLDNSRSQRVLWLLEELGLEYDITEWKRDPVTMRHAGLREVHPLGKAPVVQIGDEVLAESGAILESLLERYGEGRLVPADRAGREQLRYWMHFAEGSLMPPLLVKLITSRLRGKAVPFLVRPVAKGIASQVDGTFTDPELERTLGFIEQHLSEREWFCGEFSAADIQMSFPLEAALSRGGADQRPAIAAHLARSRARPAYQRATERGGSFSALG